MIRIIRAIRRGGLFCVAAFLGSLTLTLLWKEMGLPKHFMDDLLAAEVVVVAVAGLVGFLLGYREHSEDHRTMNDIVAPIYNESAEIRVFYTVLFVIPTVFLFLICFGALQNDHEGIGAAWAVMTWPPMFNILISIFSLSMTPWVRLHSTGWAASCHVRNSIVFPIASVLLVWLGLSIGG